MRRFVEEADRGQWTLLPECLDDFIDEVASRPGYIVVQLIGATLAALFLHAVINVSASYGSNYPASGYSAPDAFLMEAVLTLGLVSVILGCALTTPRGSCSPPREVRRSPHLALPSLSSVPARRRVSASRLIRTCPGTPAASPWLTRATIPAPFRLISAIRTSSTR